MSMPPGDPSGSDYGIATYEDAERFLNGLINYETAPASDITYDTKAFNLEDFRTFLTELGDPQLNFNAIHLAGTKGKGSTSAFLANVCQHAGYKTGLYTSPHVYRYTERIAVNGQTIPGEEFAGILNDLAAKMHASASDAGNFRTVFELLTATAFVYFTRQKVEIAIIETGLGGRLDATNVFDSPSGKALINVITPIGFDHVAILGRSIEQIASEKAGILRPHAAIVLAKQPASWRESVRAVIGRKAESTGNRNLLEATIIEVDDADIAPAQSCATFRIAETQRDRICSEAPGELSKALCEGMRLCSRMPGKHQLENLRTVTATALAADRIGISIPPKALADGTAATTWPGRFEIISEKPLLIVDGAHCRLSAAAAAETYTLCFGRREVVIVIGVMRDKAVREICEALKPLTAVAVICCTPPTPRALDAMQTAQVATTIFDAPVAVLPDPHLAVEYAISQADENQAILVIGSMFLIGPTKTAAQRTLSL